MRFACEQCQTKYTIPDERVRGKILKIRCKTCNCQITISEGGVRTARPIESAGGDTIIPTKNAALPALGEGGDATMIGGMADFFSGPAAAAPPPADEWYISIDGETAGPIPMQELAQRVVSAESSPGREIFVWREGFKEWIPPANADELKAALVQARRAPVVLTPRIATKLGLAPISPVVPSRGPAAPAADVGGSLSEENEDATQIGSLSAPIAPPATKNEISDLALEAVDFDMVTDLPAPPKPQAKPSAPPPKPKAPPAFKPPPVPGPTPARVAPAPPNPAPAPKAPPKSVPPFDITPPMSPSPAPAPPSQQPPAMAGGSTSQSFAPPPPAEDPTGAIRGSAVNAAAGSAGMSPDMHGGAGQYPQAGMMGAPDAMGGMPGDPGGFPNAGAAGSPYATGAPPAGLSDPAPEAPAGKSSQALLAVLAVVMLLGVSATVYVLTRPSKHANKTQVVDAGPPVDAMPAEPDKTQQEEKTKPKSAKDELLGITAEQRDTLLDKGKKPLASCTNKLLKKEPKLAGTTLTVEVTISGKGKIDTVDITGENKELDGKAVKCLQKAVKRWKFPKHTDKNAYQVKFGLPLEG